MVWCLRNQIECHMAHAPNAWDAGRVRERSLMFSGSRLPDVRVHIVFPHREGSTQTPGYLSIFFQVRLGLRGVPRPC